VENLVALILLRLDPPAKRAVIAGDPNNPSGIVRHSYLDFFSDDQNARSRCQPLQFWMER
jgi:hypothetical protein